MSIVTYAARVAVHADRTGGAKNRANEIFVLHTSEGSEGDNSAEALASFMTRPGDRPSSTPGQFYGSSYQYVTDTGMVAIPCTPETIVSYSAPPANTYGVHICLPGKAIQTRAQWLDGISRQYIRCAAGIMVDRSGPLGIPLVRLSLDDLKAHRRGYCDHDDIADAFGLTDHYDLGPTFPWDVLADDIAELGDTTPPPPDQEAPHMQAIAPVRLMDTRPLPGDFLPEGTVVRIAAAAGRPDWARSVVVNVTATNTTGPGYLTVWPDGPRPDTSNVNFAAGQTVANLTVVPLAGDGTFAVSPVKAGCDVVVDQQGWAA